MLSIAQFQEAAQSGDAIEVRRLLREQPRLIDDMGPCVLQLASEAGHAEVVLALLAQRPELIETEAAAGWTLLHHAARKGQWELVQALADLGPHLLYRATRTMLRTPLHFAAEKGHEKAVNVLLSQQAKYFPATAKDNATSANNAEGTIATTTQTLKQLDLVDYVDSQGLSALHLAVRHQHEGTAGLLLAHKPDIIRAVDHSKNTILHEAMRCNVAFVQALCAKYPEAVHIMNHKMQTPLFRAVQYGNEAVLEFLQWKHSFDEVMEAHLACDVSYTASLRVFMDILKPVLCCLNSDVLRVVYGYIKLSHINHFHARFILH